MSTINAQDTSASLELISAVDMAERARVRSTLTPTGAAWFAITTIQGQRGPDLPADVTIENIVALLRARGGCGVAP